MLVPRPELQLLTSLTLLFLGCVFPANAQEAGLRLPVLNLWDQAQEIEHSEELRRTINVSPMQLESLRRMLGNKDLFAAFDEKMSVENWSGTRLEQKLVFDSFEVRLRKELLLVLEPTQVTALDLYARRTLCRHSYMTFLIPDVIALCSFTQDQRRAHLQTVDEARFEVEAEMKRLKERACVQMIKTLPEPARIRLVQYIGNDLTPEIILDSNLTMADLPYPPELIDRRAYAVLKGRPELEREVNLFLEQQSALARLTGKKLQIERTRPSQLLAATQQLAVARYAAQESFTNDFVKTLSQPKLLDYLELSPEERTSVLKQANEQMRKLNEELAHLNEQTFASLLEEVPENLREPLAKRFAGTWSVE